MTILSNNINSTDLQEQPGRPDGAAPDSWAGVSIEPTSKSRSGVCLQCATAFLFPCAKGRPKKYCSEACGRTAIQQAAAEKQKAKRATPNGATCEVCASPLMGDAKRFCSARCRGAGLTPPNKGHSIVPERDCQQCGARFRPNEIGDPGKFCSVPCARRAKRVPARWLCDRPREPKACIECGGLFEPKFNTQVVCAKACQIRRSTRSQQAKLHPERRRPRSCAVCGAIFVPVYGSWARDKCSEKCSAEARAELERKHRRIQGARRRAIERDPNAERVDPIKVFTRDHWKCQLCGRKTPRSLRGKHEPASPELDHIVPLSRGGPHTYANTQCACRECNGNKGARAIGQLNFNL